MDEIETKVLSVNFWEGHGITETFLVTLTEPGGVSDEDRDEIVEYIAENLVSGVVFDSWLDKDNGTFFVEREYDPYYEN